MDDNTDDNTDQALTNVTLRILLNTGDEVTIRTMPNLEADRILQAWATPGDRTITVELDYGPDDHEQLHIKVDHIVAIGTTPQTGPTPEEVGG